MNGPPRKQVLEQLDALQREIAEYHRWLAEFPDVCRVLENIMLRIERPLPGTSVSQYRSISNLRDELRATHSESLFAIGRRIGFGRAQQILGEQWESTHDCAPRGRMGVTANDAPPSGAPHGGDQP